MMIGSQLRLLRPLGTGGMGSVWVAEHLGLKMPVAVKFLREQYLGYPQAIARLRREAAAAARIRSPHVVQIFDLQVTDDGVPYIVMELLEGESLEEHLDRNGPLSLETTAEIVRQVGAAVAKAHDLGIVHRDIKPDNVFLVETERELFVKVLDFGVALDLAERCDRLTVTGAVVGTPHFMSPEQMIGGETIGPASAVWTLGVVAYRCLTDSLPYDGDSVAAIAIAVDRGPPSPPSAIVPAIPGPVDDWMMVALEPNPSGRFPDARAMLVAFEEALAIARGDRARVPTIRDVDVMPPVTTERRVRFVSEAPTLPAIRPRRNRWRRRGLAASVVAVGLVAAAWMGGSTSSSEAAPAAAATAAMTLPPPTPLPSPPPPPRITAEPATVPAAAQPPSSSSTATAIPAAQPPPPPFSVRRVRRDLGF
ncbi:MAG: serine/threonine protein kinase [Polyangiaceae bacterium]|nr:serine/threonine protein kinase [Polyangiaceae bacterium]